MTTKTLIENIPSAASRGARPMVIASTMLLGVSLAMTGIILWAQAGGMSWVSGDAIAVGVLAVVATVALATIPRRWRLTTELLSVPVLTTIGVLVAATVDAVSGAHARWMSPDQMAFGLAIGAMSLGWITVVVVALVRERWIRRDGSEPQLDR
ncbi:MAG: hypothetical protein H6712_25720 [Myxococcales bacterium]|nr:hypothetical protein [Myxococcales bacterium]MCB9717274.1 hypothetical protein [Myxococcales bacterium]